jgi:hypothetical protein
MTTLPYAPEDKVEPVEGPRYVAVVVSVREGQALLRVVQPLQSRYHAGDFIGGHPGRWRKV